MRRNQSCQLRPRPRHLAAPETPPSFLRPASWRAPSTQPSRVARRGMAAAAPLPLAAGPAPSADISALQPLAESLTPLATARALPSRVACPTAPATAAPTPSRVADTAAPAPAAPLPHRTTPAAQLAAAGSSRSRPPLQTARPKRSPVARALPPPAGAAAPGPPPRHPQRSCRSTPWRPWTILPGPPKSPRRLVHVARPAPTACQH